MKPSIGDLRKLTQEVHEILLSEPPLIRLESKEALIVGDTHGDLYSTLNAVRRSEEHHLPIVFLGDYVDRGPMQVENIAMVLEKKLENPGHVYLLRGNHETVSMNEYYGFYEEVVRSYGVEAYRWFSQLFSQMPYGLHLDGGILCVHGGIPEGLDRFDMIGSLPKGDEDPQHPMILQLLWNDPDENIRGFQPSPRGGGARLFGEDVLVRFLDGNGLKILIRAHQPVENGYSYIFGGRLLTIFSCRYYGLNPKAAMVRDGKITIVDIG